MTGLQEIVSKRESGTLTAKGANVGISIGSELVRTQPTDNFFCIADADGKPGRRLLQVCPIGDPILITSKSKSRIPATDEILRYAPNDSNAYALGRYSSITAGSDLFCAIQYYRI